VPVAKNPVWAELIQLIPIVTFALPLIIRGEADLDHAQQSFLLAALLTLPVSGLVSRRGGVLNPILVGTGLWLWLGMVAFNAHVGSLRAWLVQTQGAGLFAVIFVIGAVTTLASPHGYIGLRHSDRRWIRRASLALLTLTAFALAWAYCFRSNIRLGGGLPFIVINVVRRVVVVRAARVRPRAA
jgi:hypothetical protein